MAAVKGGGCTIRRQPGRGREDACGDKAGTASVEALPPWGLRCSLPVAASWSPRVLGAAALARRCWPHP